jgi:tetratricopeptide (TPR) repeat protein
MAPFVCQSAGGLRRAAALCYNLSGASSMKKNICLHIYCLACLLIPAGLGAQDSSSVDKDMDTLRKYHSVLAVANKGLEFVAAKDWEAAAKQFDRCLEIMPDHPNACYGKAVISNQAGDVPQALGWIEKAEQGCISLQLVWMKQKTNWLSISKDDAKRLHELAAQTMGGNTETVGCTSQDRAYESKKTGRPSEDALQDAKGSGTSPFAVPAEFLALHGNLLFKEKRLPEAEAKYLEALAVEPAHERCLNNLVNIYFVTRRLAEAREWLDKAARLKVKVNPNLEKALREAR